VPWDGGAIRCTVWFGFVHGAGASSSSRIRSRRSSTAAPTTVFWDDPQRFAFFSKAALEFLLKSGKRPQVIHTHDWQTALVPVLLYEIYAAAGLADQRVCHTIHNFAHQGVTGAHVLDATGLHRHEYYGHPDRMGDGVDHHAINLTKGASSTPTSSPRCRRTTPGRCGTPTSAAA